MTTEEKLKHFQDICMTGARERNAKVPGDHMNALEAAFREHAADAGRWVDMQVEAETEKLGREINKRLSIGQLDLKRGASHKQEGLKDKLFMELRNKLANLMEAWGHQRFLDRQVKAAKEFAGDEELTIYMGPSDADKLQCIAMYHNATIRVSEYFFNGGTRAVLLDKRILIDNSFQIKLDEARHEPKFDLTGGRQSG